MPLDTSIENVGEYYSSHYLESTFAKDTKELLRRWKDEGSEAVPRRSQRLGRHFFRAKEQALEIDEPRRRLKSRREALRSWHGLFLEALGYTTLEPEDFPVDGGARFVPVLGRLERFGQPWLVFCETAFCLPDGSLPDGAPSENPFDLRPLRCQLVEAERTLFSNDWGRACARVLTAEDAPRWLLLVAGSRVVLLDRNTYAQGRYLAFDLDDSRPRVPAAVDEAVTRMLRLRSAERFPNLAAAQEAVGAAVLLPPGPTPRPGHISRYQDEGSSSHEFRR